MNNAVVQGGTEKLEIALEAVLQFGDEAQVLELPLLTTAAKVFQSFQYS